MTYDPLVTHFSIVWSLEPFHIISIPILFTYLFPCFIDSSQDPFVYQNCIEVEELNTIMEGYFTFRYLRPNEEPNEDPENLQEIDPSLLFKVDVAPIHLKLQPGWQFVPNPCF